MVNQLFPGNQEQLGHPCGAGPVVGPREAEWVMDLVTRALQRRIFGQALAQLPSWLCRASSFFGL